MSDYDYPRTVKPGDRIAADDGKIYKVDASYQLGNVWVFEIAGIGMMQTDMGMKVRIVSRAKTEDKEEGIRE